MRHSEIASTRELQVLFEVVVTLPEVFTGVRDSYNVLSFVGMRKICDDEIQLESHFCFLYLLRSYPRIMFAFKFCLLKDISGKFVF